MWDIHSHLLHPLTTITSPKVKFKCSHMEQRAFDYIMRAVPRHITSVSRFNKIFDIHMDASDHQLGSVIIQNGKPIDFYSCK